MVWKNIKNTIDRFGKPINLGDYVVTGSDVALVTGFTPSKRVILDIFLNSNGHQRTLRSYKDGPELYLFEDICKQGQT